MGYLGIFVQSPILSAIVVFLCVKIAELVLSSKNTTDSWGDGAVYAQPKSSVQVSSQARSLRAHVQARGSHTWGF